MGVGINHGAQSVREVSSNLKILVPASPLSNPRRQAKTPLAEVDELVAFRIESHVEVVAPRDPCVRYMVNQPARNVLGAYAVVVVEYVPASSLDARSPLGIDAYRQYPGLQCFGGASAW